MNTPKTVVPPEASALIHGTVPINESVHPEWGIATGAGGA
jgi:hypothetical protein